MNDANYATNPNPLQLPSNHFLALPPSFPSSSSSSSTSPSASDPLAFLTAANANANTTNAPSTSTLASADFDVSTRTGFLPFEPGLKDVPEEYLIWEKMLVEAKRGAVRINGENEAEVGELWRRAVEQMPVYRLPPQHLTAPILQRTSVTLTFLLHFYVHSHPASLQSTLRIPPSISVPLLQISSLLGLPPILTYATTVLYNVIPLHPGLPFHPHSNPPTRVHQTFTGTKSEEHFYLVSSLIEIHGVRALSIMRAALDEAFVGDALALKRIGAGLRQLASAIGELTQVFKEMRKGCVPEEFYWLIRPWFKGSDGDGPSSLGWLFDLGEEAKEERRVVSGPSAGQSSLIHSLDIFLGIDHSPHSTNFVAKPSAAGATLSPAAALALKKPSSEGDSTFMQRMLTYMPGPHRAFLLHLQASRPTVRDLVLSNIDFGGGELARSYDEAVTAMGKLRDGHMSIVTTYIIAQARKPPPPHLFPSLPSASIPDISSSSSTLSTSTTTIAPANPSWQAGSEKLPEIELDESEIRGTGGTALAQFLKLCKARTVRNLLV